MNASGLRLRRRTFLGATFGAALAAATGVERASAAPVAPTFASLTADPIFYVAHRGGGRDWPELTRYAYMHATRYDGLTALEISVQLSADGVLVCSHDPNTLRTTGVDYTIADETWATLSQLWVTSDATVDPEQPSRKFTALEAVLDQFAGDYVLFVEPKSKDAAAPLMERMVALGHPEQVVWKQPVNSRTFAEAKGNGFGTWGYVLNEPAHTGRNLAKYAASDAVDLLGVPRSEDDDFAAAIVQAAQDNGKQTMMWDVRTVADRTRALNLGIAGMMTSGVAEVLPVAV